MRALFWPTVRRGACRGLGGFSKVVRMSHFRRFLVVSPRGSYSFILCGGCALECEIWHVCVETTDNWQRLLPIVTSFHAH